MSDKERLLMSYLTDLDSLNGTLVMLPLNEVSLYQETLREISTQLDTVQTRLEGLLRSAQLTPHAGEDFVST
jgi:hypothetical protein